jgi:hypothetical protein
VECHKLCILANSTNARGYKASLKGFLDRREELEISGGL